MPTGTATPPRAPRTRRIRSRLESPPALVAIAAASLLVALAGTFAFRQVVARAVFVFFWAAVGGLAALGGFWAGFLTALAAFLLADWFFIAPRGFGISDTGDIASSIAFVGIAGLLSYFAELQHRARRETADHLVVAQDQASSLEMEQESSRVLAEELEQANQELEAAIDNANTARDEAERSERDLRLLDDASRLLASSLDYETTVAAVAQLAVPRLADWCAVDVLLDGQIKQLAIAHVEPEKAAWARELAARFPVDPSAVAGVPQVIRTGEPQLLPTITEQMLEANVKSKERLEILKSMRLRSAMIVPMQARGKTLGALTFISTTPHRHYNEADLAVSRELAHRSALAIDNAQLYRAALGANEAKANFLATMSHELRTPLTAIIGYEELLAEGITGPVTDGQKQQLERIKASAMHLLGLIEEILTFARVEAGQESLRNEPVAAKAIVDDAVVFVEPMAHAKGLVIKVSPIDPRLMLFTDAGKVRQILVNLLSNAVKFTDGEGGVSIRVIEDPSSWAFEVTDTGIGIPAEHLERIFDPFWQVEQHTTRTVGGSGLGLSVSRRLTETLGGKLTVQSRLGQGSTFRVTLPKE